MPSDTLLWRLSDAEGDLCCLMVSCCAGAELQVRRNDEIILRELYPDKPTLYERAGDLQDRFGRRIGPAADDPDTGSSEL